jgi:hypothetical protein
MSFKMSFTIKQDVESLVNKIRTYVQQEGGSFSGDTQKGSISLGTVLGTVKGNYVVTGSECVLEITDKPFLATQGMVESGIREALEKM